jgi:hypothetical protein
MRTIHEIDRIVLLEVFLECFWHVALMTYLPHHPIFV